MMRALTLITTTQVAMRLQCSSDNVRKLAREGRLLVALIVGPSKQRLFDAEVVEQFARARGVGGELDPPDAAV
jgi:excisionase family DNA binding protein